MLYIFPSSAGFTSMQRRVNATNNEAATPQELLMNSLASGDKSQWFTNSTVFGEIYGTTVNATTETTLPPAGASKEILSTKANETQQRKKRQSSQLNSQFDFGGSLQGTAYEGQDRLFQVKTFRAFDLILKERLIHLQREPPQGVVNTRYAALEEWRARQGREFLSING